LSDDELRFGKVGKSLKSSRWDASFIDTEVAHAIGQQEHPFLVMELVAARALSRGSVSRELCPNHVGASDSGHTFA
jgi:hypothetical protein